LLTHTHNTEGIPNVLPFQQIRDPSGLRLEKKGGLLHSQLESVVTPQANVPQSPDRKDMLHNKDIDNWGVWEVPFDAVAPFIWWDMVVAALISHERNKVATLAPA
jgi:hypothetical protein